MKAFLWKWVWLVWPISIGALALYLKLTDSVARGQEEAWCDKGSVSVEWVGELWEGEICDLLDECADPLDYAEYTLTVFTTLNGRVCGVTVDDSLGGDASLKVCILTQVMGATLPNTASPQTYYVRVGGDIPTRGFSALTSRSGTCVDKWWDVDKWDEERLNSALTCEKSFRAAAAAGDTEYLLAHTAGVVVEQREKVVWDECCAIMGGFSDCDDGHTTTTVTALTLRDEIVSQLDCADGQGFWCWPETDGGLADPDPSPYAEGEDLYSIYINQYDGSWWGYSYEPQLTAMWFDRWYEEWLFDDSCVLYAKYYWGETCLPYD